MNSVVLRGCPRGMNAVGESLAGGGLCWRGRDELVLFVHWDECVDWSCVNVKAASFANLG